MNRKLARDEELRKKRARRAADLLSQQGAGRSMGGSRAAPPPHESVVSRIAARDEDSRRAWESQGFDLARMHRGLGNAAVHAALEPASTGGEQLERDEDAAAARGAALLDALLLRDVQSQPRDPRNPGEGGAGTPGHGPADGGGAAEESAPDPVAPAGNSPGSSEASGGAADGAPGRVVVRDPASGLDISYDLGGGAPDVDLRQVRQGLGSGKPLEPETKDYMEWRFGVSFDKVRIHTGPKADAISKALFAHAFALGPDVAFQSYAYRPGTREGDFLLAHELTHVVQAGEAPRGERDEEQAPVADAESAEGATRSAARAGAAAGEARRSASVSEPTDPMEVEADRNAGEVVRVGRAEFARWKREEDERARREREEEAAASRRAPASQLMQQALQDGGRPLPGPLRERLEARFQRDLSGVRIHDGAAAAAAAAAIHAEAATVGEHIVFADGAYRPGTPAGDELIAHEVTHAVQHQEGREGAAAALEGDVPVTAPDSAVEVEARETARDFVRELAAEPAGATEASEPAQAAGAAEAADSAPALESGIGPDPVGSDVAPVESAVSRQETNATAPDAEGGEGALTPEQQAQLAQAEAALGGLDVPEPEEVEDASAAGPTDAAPTEEPEPASGDGGGGGADVEVAPAGGGQVQGGGDTPAPSGPTGAGAAARPLDGLVDHYMATHWDSSEFDSKVQEFGIYPDALATELDRWLPASTSSSTRAAANLLVGLGAGLMDSFFQEFAKSVPGFGMIAHALLGLRDAWQDASAYADNGDTAGAIIVALRHTVNAVGGIAGNLGDLATAVEDGCHVLAPFVAGISEIIGVPAAGIATGCQAVNTFCAGATAGFDLFLTIYDLIQANQAEAAGNFQRAAFFRDQARTQALRTITSVIKCIVAATSTMTAGVVPGGAPQNMTQLLSSSFQQFTSSFGNLVSSKGGLDTAGNLTDRFLGPGDTALGGFFQGYSNLLAVSGFGDSMRRSRGGFAGGDFIDRQGLETAGDSALEGLRGARQQTLEQMNADAEALEGEKPLWHQQLINRILAPESAGFVSYLNMVVNPSEWIRIQFAGLRWVMTALGDGGLEAVAGLAGMAGEALSGIAQPFIDNVNEWIGENKPRMDEWLGEMNAKLQEQAISLQSLRDAADGAQQFLDRVSAFGDEGGMLDSAIDSMIAPLESFRLSAESLGIPDWVPSFIYNGAINLINRGIARAAALARDLGEQVRAGINERLDSLADWARDQVTLFQEAIAEGGEVETLLNQQLAEIQALVAQATAAFQAWDGRIPLDLTGAADWLQQMARAAGDATTAAKQARWVEYVGTSAQSSVDTWKGAHGDQVRSNYFPTVPAHEIEAVQAAFSSLRGALDPVARDAANPYSESAGRVLAGIEAAYNACMAFNGQQGADALRGLWAAEEQLVAAAAVPLEAAPSDEELDGGLPEGGVADTGSDTGGGEDLDAGVPVQPLARAPLRGDVQSLASEGTAGSGGPLPHQAAIQKSFGRHDVSAVRAHTGPQATQASAGMGALAFARGQDVAFAGSPDLHTAAHEAAHIVQQQQGVQLYGGVGKVGDVYERHADAVADAVVAGRSAEALLNAGPGSALAAAPTAQGAGAETEKSNTHADSRASAGNGAGLASAGPAPVQMQVADTASQFLTKGYMAQAREWDGLGGNLSDSFSQDEQAQQAEVPTFHEEMGPPSAEGAPLESEVGTPVDEVCEPQLDSTAPSEPDFAEVREGRPPPMPSLGSIPSEDSGASEDEVERIFDRAVSGTPTEVSDMDTSPGPPPDITLDGQSDPAQADQNRDQMLADAERARAEAEAAVDAIVPENEVTYTTVAEEHTIDAPEVPQIDGMEHIGAADEILAMGLPQDVQDQADQMTQAQLDASTAEARGQIDQVVSERDSEQSRLVEDANAENQRLIDQANSEQQAEVEGARRNIESSQRETEQKQRDAVADADARSQTERESMSRDVENRIAQDQRQINQEFSDAEREAEAKKREAERDAEAKKREAEEKKDDGGGLFGWIGDAISAAFDWLKDAINAVLDALVSAVTAIIDAAKAAANALIDACRDFVVGLIEAFGDFLKGLVNALLADLFPEFAAWLNEQIDAAVQAATDAVNWIADRLKEGINALLDGLKAGILAAIEAARAGINLALDLAQAALTGDWETFAKKLLEAALDLAGIDKATFDSVLQSGIDTIKTILDDPGAFVGHVIDAVGQGFSQFADNFLTHLQNGFFEWLAGPLGEGGITLPSTWDLAGIFGLVMQVLGLTREGIRGVIEEELGETAGVVFDYVWRYVGALIQGGLEGLWEEVQNDLGNLWSMVVDGIKNWVLETIVKQAVIKIASMFSPVGALVQALVTAYNVYCFLRDNIQRIWRVVQTVVEMMAQIANGNIGPAANGVESALASLVPVAISLLANLIGLGGIGDKVREVIQSIHGTVHGAIRSLIRRVKGMFRGGGAEGEEGGAEGGEISYANLAFSAATAEDGGQEAHHLYAQDQGGQVAVLVASNPAPVASATADRGEFAGLDDAQTAQVIQLCQDATRLYGEGKAATDPAVKQQKDQAADTAMEQAKTILAGVAGATLEARANQEGGLAVRKLGEVRGDANCGSLKDEWERGSLARHTGGNGTVIDAMRSEVSSSGRKYTCKGPKVPDSEIQSHQGVSRVAPLDAIWRFNLPGDVKSNLFLDNQDYFIACVNGGLYNPDSALTGSISGQLAQAWWFPSDRAPSATLSELRRDLALGDTPAYAAGAIRFDFTPADAMAGLDLHKPTAFDGMPFGEFVLSPGSVWGMTAGGSPEAVAPEIGIQKASRRTPVPGPANDAKVLEFVRARVKNDGLDLDKVHDSMKGQADSVLAAKKREIVAARAAGAAKALVEADPVFTDAAQRPLGNSPYGRHVEPNQAVPQAQAALQQVGLPVSGLGVSVAEFVSRRKGQFTAGAGKYADAKTKLSEELWDKAKEGEANNAVKDAFVQVLTEVKEVHDKYKPQNLTEPEVINDAGDTKLTYTGFRGAQFEVIHNASGMLQSITGTGLTLKGTLPDDVSGRGSTGTAGRRTADTQDSAAHERLLQESSHLIADRFRGSGYKAACNLITTSAYYNDPVMKDVEDEIAEIAENCQELTLTVSVDWMEFRGQEAVTALLDKALREADTEIEDEAELAALRTEIQSELDARFARMRSQNIKRVKGVRYHATFAMNDGSSQTKDWTTRVDTWL